MEETMSMRWELTWAIVVWLNRVLNRCGLCLVGTQKMLELEHVWCEWPYVMNRLNELERAEEERESEVL